MTDRGRERVWTPGRPVLVGQLLAPLRRGAGDPTYAVTPDGAHWRSALTPAGAGTLRITSDRSAGLVRATAWGDGAEWLLHGLPALLGDEDDWSGFRAGHPVVEEALRRHPHWRIGRTGLVHDALLPAILEQKVTGQEAFAGYRRLVRRFGRRAPGPADGPQLWCPPSPAEVAAVPSWEWIRLPVDPARSRTAVTAARAAAALERGLVEGSAELDRRLRALPGVGVWTSAETRARAAGDPDAVSFGDYHVAKDVGWALVGHPVDDAEMARLLEPWRGHRRRVAILLLLAVGQRPQRGPRMAPRRHLPR